MKPKLIDGFDTTDGTVGIIYADQASDLGGAEYVGVEKSNLSNGSIAYDKVLNTYVFNGENWVKDDGTTIPNSAGGLTKFAECTFTGILGDSVELPVSLPILKELSVTFDDEEYYMERKEGAGKFYYGELEGMTPAFDNIPFFITLLHNLPVIMVNDENEHTVTFSGLEQLEELSPETSLTLTDGEALLSAEERLIEATTSYKAVINSEIYYGFSYGHDETDQAVIFRNTDIDPDEAYYVNDNPDSPETYLDNESASTEAVTFALYKMVE